MKNERKTPDSPAKQDSSAPLAAGEKVAITVKEFLALTSISNTKFYAEVKAGRIKTIKLGRKTLIPATEPKAWMERLSGQAAA